MELEKNPKTRKLYRRLLELEDQVGKRPFPQMRRIKQITSSHCGPAVLEALFSFLGKKVSQRSIVKSLRAGQKIRRIGLSVKDLARAVNARGKKGFIFWKKANSTIADLDRIVNKFRYPVGVEWQGVFYEFEDEDNGHYGVVTSVDRKAGEIRISDPYPEFAGVDRKFEIGFFTKRWWDINLINGRRITDKRMMFLVTPVGDSWPKKLGMKKA